MRRPYCLVVAALLRLRLSRLPDRTQPIISVTARLASVPIDGGKSDVERLARRGEMYFEPAVPVRQFKRLLQKSSHRGADGRGLVVREKAVAVELDENPLRPPVNAYAGASPAAQTFERERITGRQDAVVNSRRGQSMPPPAPIKNKRAGQQNRQRHFAADAQVLSRPVRGGFVEWATALVQRVDSRRLGLQRRRWQGQIGVTSGFGQNTHLGVHAAAATAHRIGERQIAMHERISRLPHSIEPRKALVLFREQVAELFERPPQVLRRVRPLDAVMQMNLHFAEAVRFQFCQSFEQRAVILLGRIEVGMTERRSVAIAYRAAGGAGLFEPFIYARAL